MYVDAISCFKSELLEAGLKRENCEEGKSKQACEEQNKRPMEFKRRVVAVGSCRSERRSGIPRFARNDNIGCDCE